MTRPSRTRRFEITKKVVCVIFFLNAAMALAKGEESEPKITFSKAFQFCEYLFDRNLEFHLTFEDCKGSSCFDRREVPPIGNRGTRFRTTGVVRGDRQVLRYEEQEMIPNEPQIKTEITRVMRAKGREAFVTLGFSVDEQEVYFSENKWQEPVMGSGLVNFADPLFWGLPRLEEISSGQPSLNIKQLNSSSFTGIANNGLTATFDGWQIEVGFAPSIPSLPYTITATNQGRPVKSGGYTRACQWLIPDWFEHDGIKVPRKIEKWILRIDDQGELHTSYRLSELLSIGPKQEVSDRYGDHFTDIPNGTTVFVKDYEGIEFIWQDGEIVRKIDKVKLATMVGKRFFPSPFRRFVLMGFGGVALLALGWFIWRWSRGGGGFKARGFEKI